MFPARAALLVKSLIIGSALALLAGCSALGVAYSNGPTLAYWWADGWFDFDSRQAPRVRAALGRWFDWHLNTQLEPTAALLDEAAAAARGPISAEALCRWNERFRDALAPSIDRALAEAAELVPLIGPGQFAALEKRYAEELAEDRDELLQVAAVERRQEALKRARERFERFYGTLTEAQIRVLEQGLATSPFDPERFIAERQRRQGETLATLKRLASAELPREQRAAELKALSERATASPDPAYRVLQQRLVQHNCALGARLHEAATPRQRERAAGVLAGWAADLRGALPSARAPARGAGTQEGV